MTSPEDKANDPNRKFGDRNGHFNASNLEAFGNFAASLNVATPEEEAHHQGLNDRAFKEATKPKPLKIYGVEMADDPSISTPPDENVMRKHLELLDEYPTDYMKKDTDLVPQIAEQYKDHPHPRVQKVVKNLNRGLIGGHEALGQIYAIFNDDESTERNGK